jgi:DNA-binding NtrC family response regulator
MTRPLILVVDDQACVAQAARLLLEYAGMDVLTATTPAEAKGIWERHKSDVNLLLADFDLDDSITGEQLAKSFEADRPELKSLIVSAYALDDHRFPGRTEGVDFFQKPWDCGAIVSAVQWLLKNQAKALIPSEDWEAAAA